MPDFLLELRSEEIPARMQAGARGELEKLFRRELDASGVSCGDISVWSTPRRLALIARELPDSTEAVSEEAKGPPESAPDQAVEGFCRKNGVTRDQLEVREVKGRATYFAVKDLPGRATRDLLAEAIPAIIRDFSWPKSMRWGAASMSTESLRWVRPLSGIVALLGADVVECDVHGIKSGRETAGHRFHGIRKTDPKSRNFGLPIEIFKDKNPTILNDNGMIEIGNVAEYDRKLADAHVIVNHRLREEEIRIGARAAATGAGLKLVEDEGLVIENAGLTEWPVPLLGRFDEEFLTVPPEVIQLTARTNQKYFVCTSPLPHAGGAGGGPDSALPRGSSPTPNPSRKREGDANASELANAFVCTANIAAEDGGTAIVDGNRKVLAARLADARFFWDVDRKRTLAQHAEGLARITFHEKLGTVADKVERVAKLARWLVEEGIVTDTPLPPAGGAGGGPDSEPLQNSAPTPNPSRRREGNLADLAEQAARLAKADLVTEMVGEFPELQGLMGGYYARAEGLPDAVADAIRDHYKPVGQGDDVPTAPVTVAVSLADKLDNLFAFFALGELPTGSKDPFALRRAALGANILILKNDLRFSFIAAMLFGIPNVGASMARALSAQEAVLLKPIFETKFLANSVTTSDMASELDWESNPMLQKIAANVQASMQLLANFMTDRLKVQQREAGVRHDLIDAVFALGGEDDLVRLLARVKALQAFMDTDNGTNLLTGYKRAANILKKEEWPIRSRHPGLDPGPSFSSDVGAEEAGPRLGGRGDEGGLSYTPEPAEKALIDALDAAAPKAEVAVAQEEFAAAMSALASLRAPIDRFFDEVTVNDENADKRAHRLELLARFRDAVHKVADFSRIEGG